MSPLSNEIRLLSESGPPHLGPAIPAVSSIWFKLFLYNHTGSGPITLLLKRGNKIQTYSVLMTVKFSFCLKGSRIRDLPNAFNGCKKLLVTSWNHEPTEIPFSNALTMLWDALKHLPVLVQAIPESDSNAKSSVVTKHFAFPITETGKFCPGYFSPKSKIK